MYQNVSQIFYAADCFTPSNIGGGTLFSRATSGNDVRFSVCGDRIAFFLRRLTFTLTHTYAHTQTRTHAHTHTHTHTQRERERDTHTHTHTQAGGEERSVRLAQNTM